MAEKDQCIYKELGVTKVINAAGTKTRVGGTRIRSEAVDAMHRASASFARISDLQARASETIAESMDVEAGYVASGAAACLTLAAAACMTRDSLAAMARLPDTRNLPDEFLIPTAHRNSYDHALRASGASLVNIGNNDRTLGPGASDLELWELESAIDDQTAGIVYVARNDIPFEPFVEVAHEHDIPVIVDAAGKLPPKHNLTRFTEAGADLVVFSGGKAVRGPQSTGFVGGRRDLISAIALQHLDMDAVEATWDPPSSLIDAESIVGVPRHGIGRGLKVGKEELVGFIRALEIYVDQDESEQMETWHQRSKQIGQSLDSVSTLDVEYQNEDDTRVVTRVEVIPDVEQFSGRTVDVIRTLQQETPRIVVGYHGLDDRFVLNPMSLTDGEAEIVVDSVISALPSNDK